MSGKKTPIKKNSLAYGYLLLTIMPLLAVIVILSIFTLRRYSVSVNEIVSEELETVGKVALDSLEKDVPGDYSIREVETVQGIGYEIVKGETTINKMPDYFDSMKDITGVEYSLIYADTRIITTLYDKTNMRAVGTGVNDQVITAVYDGGQKAQFDNVTINGALYLTVYMPVRNSDGKIIGMLELAKQRTEISGMIKRALIPLFVIALLCVVFFAIISLKSAKGTLERIKKLERFLIKVAEGNLGESMHQDVLSKKDELGEAGHAAISMQRSLRNLIEKDALTEIYNRRYATGYMTKVLKKAQISGQPFAIAIGDIDFFKKVNDTYGHECGDVVLKEVAAILRNQMTGHGMAARFGGEEFLMVFDKEGMEDAAGVLQEALEKLRRRVFDYENQEFHVTMTFGVVDGDTEKGEDELFKMADDKLYNGKQSGRNRVVV